MPEIDDFEFDSLLNDDNSSGDTDFDGDDLFTFDDIEEPESISEINEEKTRLQEAAEPAVPEDPARPRRTSQDFEPDMDALLITAQSPMIIEGMKYMTLKDFSSKTYTVYMESVKGIDLYIKILQRNPNNYHKLSKLLGSDIDCREVEKTAFNLYRVKYHDSPQTDDQKLRAFELLKEKLMKSYNKALISRSMSEIKKYFMLSGGLDETAINRLVQTNDVVFKTTIAKMNQHIKTAMGFIKKGNVEIVQGLKGKDINIFIIKASQLLGHYYQVSGNAEAAEYYQRIHNNYKKYHVIRD